MLSKLAQQPSIKKLNNFKREKRKYDVEIVPLIFLFLPGAFEQIYLSSSKRLVCQVKLVNQSCGHQKGNFGVWIKFS